MQLDVYTNYKEKLSKIEEALGNSNYTLCMNMATDMLRAYDYIGFSHGVFIGEFFESVFQNLRRINVMCEVEDAVTNEINEKIKNLIRLLKESVPLNEGAIKIKIFDLMEDIRTRVTKLQIECYRGEKKRKKRVRRLGMPPEIIAELEGPEETEES